MLNQLPYDNLYKFMTALGLGLVIACAVAMAATSSSYQAERIQMLEGLVSSHAKKDASVMDQEYRDAIIALMNIGTSNTEFSLIVLIIGFILGLIVTVWGFVLWYNRVQVYKDKVLRLEVDMKIDQLLREKTNASGV